MADKKYTEFTDEELLKEEKELKSFSVMNAFMIGILLGIIVFSIRFSIYGFALIIPVFFIYKFMNDPRNTKMKELNVIIKQRNLRR